MCLYVCFCDLQASAASSTVSSETTPGDTAHSGSVSVGTDTGVDSAASQAALSELQNTSTPVLSSSPAPSTAAGTGTDSSLPATTSSSASAELDPLRFLGSNMEAQFGNSSWGHHNASVSTATRGSGGSVPQSSSASASRLHAPGHLTAGGGRSNQHGGASTHQAAVGSGSKAALGAGGPQSASAAAAAVAEVEAQVSSALIRRLELAIIAPLYGRIVKCLKPLTQAKDQLLCEKVIIPDCYAFAEQHTIIKT